MDYKPQMHFGSYVFDPVNECLWRDKERITLRPKADAVLSHLLSHPGVLVTKKQLLQVVWPDTLVNDAVLKDCIRHLREVLGDPAKDSQFIQTVHRRGYRFIAELRKASADSSAPKYPPPQASKVSTFGVAEQPGRARLLARDERLSQLRACLERALNGESQCLFITGEAGIGKTTLVDAFLKEASTIRDILIAKGDCLYAQAERPRHEETRVSGAGKNSVSAAMLKTEFSRVISSTRPTKLVTFISLNSIPLDSARLRNSNRTPNPCASIAVTLVRSSTITRALVWASTTLCRIPV